MITNTALADETEAVNSIYNVDTLIATSGDDESTATVLTLPDLPFSFTITFPRDYPDVPPHITGTQSTGPQTKKGDGEAALNVLRDRLGHIFTPGQVCLFDLIEEVTPLLQRTSTSESDVSSKPEPVPSEHDGASRDHLVDNSTLCDTTSASHASNSTHATRPDPGSLLKPHIKDLTSKAVETGSSTSEPQWTISQPLLVSRSSFVARALQVASLREATSALSHLISTNKKVATATHNITAWRIKTAATDTTPEIIVQDSDDDGETAAGGRLLHLMQLMDVWSVVVVVTRWYGGVKLGPDRFRCINIVARDALVRGGFAKEDDVTAAGKKGKGKKH